MLVSGTLPVLHRWSHIYTESLQVSREETFYFFETRKPELGSICGHVKTDFYAIVQIQKAVTAHFPSEQLLPAGFSRQCNVR